MHLCLFEDATVRHLAPLTLTRHAADLRLGMHTVAEMHRRAFRPAGLAFHARPLVAAVTQQEHPDATVNALPGGDGVLFVNARYVPAEGDLLDRLRAAAQPGEPATAFLQNDALVAAWHPSPPADLIEAAFVGPSQFEGMQEERVEGARLISRLWDLIDGVEEQVARDFAALGQRGIDGAEVHDGALVVGDDVFLAPGARILPGAVVSAADGPVFVGEGATVEENAVVKGPCYLGPKATVKAMARVDGSALGVHGKVGGEVHASVVHSLSNKGHDGYLGNSYLGRWCNLGADTNTSNLKNDYGEVTVFDPVAGEFVGTGRQFAGLFMADHAKCAINTAFNTGTVVGVSCNLFGAGFPPRHIPSFSWGGAERTITYRLAKALRVAEAVMSRRGVPLTDADRAMLTAVYEGTAEARGD